MAIVCMRVRMLCRLYRLGILQTYFAFVNLKEYDFNSLTHIIAGATAARS